MIRIEKEINDSIQHIEDIIDNIKGDLELVFDENVDNKTRIEATKTSVDLIKDDLEKEASYLASNIQTYFVHKDDFKEVVKEEANND